MTAEAVAQHKVPRANGKRPSASRSGRERIGSFAGPVVQAGEMVELLVSILWSAIRHPRGYWGDLREQMVLTARLVTLPLAIAVVPFAMGAPGIQAGNLFMIFGIPERLGSFFVMASAREFAPWVDAMMVGGVMGTAITADLGARVIRQEIDAMRVLGIDPIRALVLPRVLAIAVMTGLFDLFAIALGTVGGWIAAVPLLGANTSEFMHSFSAIMTPLDVWGSVAKTTLFGLMIGVVCCYKGLSVAGGPIGVGRAVNQAVVISFASIWVLNAVFTGIMLGMNPGMAVFK